MTRCTTCKLASLYGAAYPSFAPTVVEHVLCHVTLSVLSVSEKHMLHRYIDGILQIMIYIKHLGETKKQNNNKNKGKKINNKKNKNK